MSEDNDFPRFELADADADVLDALIEAGLDMDGARAVAGEAWNGERAGRVVSLLGLLDTSPGEDRDTLINLTYLRAVRATSPVEDALHPEDAEALDAWIMSGRDVARVPASLRPRASRHARLSDLITAGPAHAGPVERGDLIERTLARVQDAVEDEQRRLSIEAHRESGARSRFRLADVVSVAAMLLIGAAVMLPVLSSVRATSGQFFCSSNLASVAGAMGLYAGAHRDNLPAATAGFGGSWMNVGTTPSESNSANLYVLVRTEHIPLAELACPGNPEAREEPAGPDATDWQSLEEISYSYQIMAGGSRPMWKHDAGRPVMADRSPVVLRVARGKPANPYENSPNHEGRGQRVLLNDGSSAWIRSPVLDNGDNIWLPRSIEQVIHEVRARMGLIEGNELPDGPDDVFLGP